MRKRVLKLSVLMSSPGAMWPCAVKLRQRVCFGRPASAAPMEQRSCQALRLTDRCPFAPETVTFPRVLGPRETRYDASLLAGHHVPTGWHSSAQGLAQGPDTKAVGPAASHKTLIGQPLRSGEFPGWCV